MKNKVKKHLKFYYTTTHDFFSNDEHNIILFLLINTSGFICLTTYCDNNILERSCRLKILKMSWTFTGIYRH